MIGRGLFRNQHFVCLVINLLPGRSHRALLSWVVLVHVANNIVRPWFWQHNAPQIPGPFERALRKSWTCIWDALVQQIQWIYNFAYDKPVKYIGIGVQAYQKSYICCNFYKCNYDIWHEDYSFEDMLEDVTILLANSLNIAWLCVYSSASAVAISHVSGLDVPLP